MIFFSPRESSKTVLQAPKCKFIRTSVSGIILSKQIRESVKNYIQFWRGCEEVPLKWTFRFICIWNIFFSHNKKSTFEITGQKEFMFLNVNLYIILSIYYCKNNIERTHEIWIVTVKKIKYIFHIEKNKRFQNAKLFNTGFCFFIFI